MTHIKQILYSCPRGATILLRSSINKSSSLVLHQSNQSARKFTSRASTLCTSTSDRLLKSAHSNAINDPSPNPNVKNETTAAHPGSAPQIQANGSLNNFEPSLIANPSISKSVPTQSQQSTQNPPLVPELSVETSPASDSDVESNENPTRKDSFESLLKEVDPRTVSRVYYFDTLALTKKLAQRGFTREQAEGCVECLLDVIGSTLEHQAKHMVTKTEQKIVQQQLQSDILSVKKDMVLLQKSEFSALRTETEKISIDMNRIQSHFQDEVVKLKGQFTLDVNLERSRAVEAHAGSEKAIQTVDNKIETEIAHLKTTYEVYRNDIFKYAAGTVLTCTTLIIGFIRLWK